MQKRTIGISTHLEGLTAKNFAAYREGGIGAVEVSVADVDYDRLDLSEAASLARAEGIDTWSFHLRFMPFKTYNIALTDQTKRDFAVRYAAEWIRRAGAEGFRYAVIHPSGEPIADQDRAETMQASMDSLHTLAGVARSAGITLAVENLPRTCLGKNSAELLQLLQADSSLRVCFDTNHLLEEPTLDFMEVLREKIVTLHVSDYDFVNERHWLPGDGLVNWKALMDKLDEIGYAGVFLYETRKTLADNKERILTIADYRRNADLLEARRI